ncbi:hypothetical protein [Agromyces sp. Soil535]|uniref:hypothetical protein n=1 Tax=Agromyces sp. Soil535 TaxID=1736390 RepID=UPI000AFF7359|nr:hypothetical protein [Agromyces sp. Soil535]
MASVVDRRVVVVPWPVWAQFALAQVTEWTMKVPLVAKAQVRMLAEGVTDAASTAASALAATPQDPHWHPEDDVLVHSLWAADLAAAYADASDIHHDRRALLRRLQPAELRPRRDEAPHASRARVPRADRPVSADHAALSSPDVIA